MPRVLHPALKARSEAVKAAHAHLKATDPAFQKLAPIAQFKAVHAHLKSVPK